MKNQLTRSGVAYNIEMSPYSLVVDYPNGEHLEYVFTSQLYKDIFYKKFIDNRTKINESLTKRFGMNIEFDILADLKLYAMTEKRGFLIKGKEEYKCLSTILLNGVILTQRN